MPPIQGRRAQVSNSSPGNRPNTIGAGERELAALLDRMDRTAGGRAVDAKRTHARWPFRHASLSMALDHPGGSSVGFRVACRNLSRGGTSVMHNSFVHTGTPCAVTLPRLDGTAEVVRGKVVRCVHVSGIVHELGILFDEPVRLADYVRVDPAAGIVTFERVDPERLIGTVVLITDSELDERIVRHYLADTQLGVRVFPDAASAAAAEPGEADVALVDLSLKGAEQLVGTARSVGLADFVTVFGVDSELDPRRIQALGPDGVLRKPLSSERVLGVLAEFLLTGEPEADASPSGPASPALAAKCIEQIQTCAEELREALTGQDAMRCYAICQHIKALSAPAGSRHLGRAAERASGAVARSMSVSEAAQALRDLGRACERVKPNGTAAA